MRYCKANTDCPTELLIWISRSYLSSIAHGFPTRQQIHEEIAGCGGDQLIEAVCNAWDVIVASSHETVALHELGCPCLSLHEQVLVTALRSLQQHNPVAARGALAAILPPATISTMAAKLQQLSDAMAAIGRPVAREKTGELARRPSGWPELHMVH